MSCVDRTPHLMSGPQSRQLYIKAVNIMKARAAIFLKMVRDKINIFKNIQGEVVGKKLLYTLTYEEGLNIEILFKLNNLIMFIDKINIVLQLF